MYIINIYILFSILIYILIIFHMYPQLSYYYEHRDYKLQYQKEYYQKNKEWITKYYKSYYEKNKSIDKKNQKKKSKKKNKSEKPIIQQEKRVFSLVVSFD